MVNGGSTPPDAPTLLLFIILFIHSITHHKEVRAVRNRFEFIIVTGTQECDHRSLTYPRFLYGGAKGEVAQLVE